MITRLECANNIRGKVQVGRDIFNRPVIALTGLSQLLAWS
jgi:hypothetical protein